MDTKHGESVSESRTWFDELDPNAWPPVVGDPGMQTALDQVFRAFDERDHTAVDLKRLRAWYARLMTALGPLSVLLLAVQVIYAPHQGSFAVLLITLEALLILVAVLATRGWPDCVQPHFAWIENRLRAELLRREMFLMLASVGPYLRTEDPQHAASERLARLHGSDTDDSEAEARALLTFADDAVGEGGSWRDALEESHFRGESLTKPPPGFATYYRKHRLDQQAAWFEERRERDGAIDHGFERAVSVTLYLAFLLAVVHLAFLIGGSWPHGIAAQVESLIIIAAISLPPLGAAVVGLRALHAAHRLQHAYGRQAERLRQLSQAMDEFGRQEAARGASDRETLLLLKRLVLRTEALLTRELEQWWLIVSPEIPRGH